MTGIQVRNLQRHDGGPCGRHFWTAEIVNGDQRLPVTRRYGSWLAESPTGLRELPRELAARLQAKVRPLERRDQREAA